MDADKIKENFDLMMEINDKVYGKLKKHRTRIEKLETSQHCKSAELGEVFAALDKKDLAIVPHENLVINKDVLKQVLSKYLP